MTTNHQTSIASLAKKRRTYSAEFKQQIVQACKAPDVSIASVALQHGLNTNLVSKWIRLIDAKPGNDRSPLPNKPTFIRHKDIRVFEAKTIHTAHFRAWGMKYVRKRPLNTPYEFIL